MKKWLKNLVLKWLLADDVLIFNIEQRISRQDLESDESKRLGISVKQMRLADMREKMMIAMQKNGAFEITSEQSPDPLEGEKLTMKVKILL